MYRKYKSEMVVIDGIKFDSRKEGRRYLQLAEMERKGEISNLTLQKKYILIPAQRETATIGKRGGQIKGKLIERECSYIADFVYDMSGETIVEDTKGFRTTEYIIKRKLMLYVYGIRIKEI